MDKKNITPEQNQPINRITSGQLPAELAELSEEILQDEAFAPALEARGIFREVNGDGEADIDADIVNCSFDGDDAE